MAQPTCHYWENADGRWLAQLPGGPVVYCGGKQAAMDYVAFPEKYEEQVHGATCHLPL